MFLYSRAGVLVGGYSSVVEYKLPKLGVASSTLVARSSDTRCMSLVNLGSVGVFQNLSANSYVVAKEWMEVG